MPWTHSWKSWGATSPPRLDRNTGCEETSSTTWTSPPSYTDSELRHPGVQPVRRGSAAHRRICCPRSTSCCSICRMRVGAATPGWRRCSTCSRPARRPARKSGCWIGPNPAGRPIEGTKLVPGQESFVGVASDSPAPRPDPWRAGAIHGRAFRARPADGGGAHAGLPPRRRTGVWLAAGHDLGQPQPGHRQSQLRPLLHRYRPARGHEPIRGARNLHPVGGLRGARSEGRGAAPAHDRHGPRLLPRMLRAALFLSALL